MFNFFGPTGVVANPYTSAFIIPGTGTPAAFIFDTLDGLIVGWNSAKPDSGGRGFQPQRFGGIVQRAGDCGSG